MSESLQKSILELTQELVRIPTRAQQDDYAPLFSRLGSWLDDHKVPNRLLDNGKGPIALLIELGNEPGPTYLLNATIDTVGFGDKRSWLVPPTSAEVIDGWLYGRGSADSKAGVAIFSHVAAEFAPRSGELRGQLHLLFDADEHTGGFGGLRSYLARSPSIAGAMLGYPGMDVIGAGSRGFERAVLSVRGIAAHSGSGSNAGINALERAARLVLTLQEAELPGAKGRFTLPPKVTATHIRGGDGFSAVPDLCRIGVDIRLTPDCDRDWARALVQEHVGRLDREWPGPAPTRIQWREGWPAYQLPSDSTVLRALSESAAEVLGTAPPSAIVGPSNIGNFLYQSGVEATCGFGVRYVNLHGADERIEVASMDTVFRIYRLAVERLLTAER